MDELKGGRAAENGVTIDRDTDQPIYLQVAESLRQQILAGVFHPGERLPSEVMLVEQYKVSPMTVRRAINWLAAQGVVSPARGSGTYVKEVELGSASFYLNDLKELFNDDSRTTVQLLEARFCPADERIARKLHIKAGERVIFIRRLIQVESKPAYYHREYLINDPHRPVIEAELEVTDLRGIFQGSGSSLIKHGDLYLESTILDNQEAALLEVKTSTSGMLLEHIFYDFDNHPVSWGWFVCSSKRLRLHTQIGIEQTNGKRDEYSR